MPFVEDPTWLDRVTFEKGPGSVHDRVLRIAREATPPWELSDGRLSVFSRFGEDFAGGSLECLQFLMKLEREFGPFEESAGFWPWACRFATGGTSRAFPRELEGFAAGSASAGCEMSCWTLGHFILFFEGREQG